MDLDSVIEEEFLQLRNELGLFDMHLENNNLPYPSLSRKYRITRSEKKTETRFLTAAFIASKSPGEIKKRVRYQLLWAISDIIPVEQKPGKFSEIFQKVSGELLGAG